MDKELYDLISQSLRKKELIEDVVAKLESAGVTLKEHFFASTLKELYSYGLSSFGVNKLRSILTQSVEWYSPEEIVNFLTSGDENITEVRVRLIDVFSEWNNWSLLQGEINSPESFLENFEEEDRKYGNVMIDILTDLSKFNEKELELAVVSNIVFTKIQAFEKRIPVPGDFETLYSKQSQLKELKVKFNKKLEYQNRMNRKDAQSPEPIIQIQLPKGNEGHSGSSSHYKASNAFQFHQNRLSCFLEDITDEFYSVVVFVGATGAGKSLAIRTGLSSESSHLPISKFGVTGTTSDVCFYLSSREELLGSTKNISGKDSIIFVDTEGTNALCAMNETLPIPQEREPSADGKGVQKTMRNLMKMSISHLSDDVNVPAQEKDAKSKRKEKDKKEKKEKKSKEKKNEEKAKEKKSKMRSPRNLLLSKKSKEIKTKEAKEKKEKKKKSPRNEVIEPQTVPSLPIAEKTADYDESPEDTNSDKFTDDFSESLSARRIEIDSETTKLRNECLKNIFPLAYFMSTVIVYTVSSLEVLRREETFNDIKSFTQYIQGKNSVDIIKPSLIILVNRYNSESDNDLNYIKNLYFEVMENEFLSFSSVQFLGFPQCGLRSGNGGKIILDDTEYAKVKRFYEILSSTIANVNASRSNGILQSALTFNQYSYSKLIGNVCNALPNPVDLKTFWKEQIFRVMFSGKEKSFPSRKCVKFINSYQEYMVNIMKEKIDVIFERIESSLIKLFNYFWILQLMEIKGIGVHNLLEQIEVQDKVQIYQNDLEELRSVFTKVLAPCGFHKLDNGKKIFCSQPQTNHSFHRVKVPVLSFIKMYTVKKIDGDFIPICTLENHCDSLMDEARKFITLNEEGNQIFNFSKFYHTYLYSAIPKFVQPPFDWKTKDSKMRKTIVNNHKSYFKNGICRICHTNPTEYIFSCELPHSICESCYRHFIDSKSEFPQFPFCPFCDILNDPPRVVSVSHIFNFVGHQTETDPFPFRGMDQSVKPNENSLYIVSIIGSVQKEDIISMNRRILMNSNRDEISDLPASFVEFAQFSSIVTAWCMFADDRLAIVYYCSQDDDEETKVLITEDFSDAKKYAYAEISSSIIVNIEEKCWSEPGSHIQRYEKLDDLWDLIFNKVAHQTENIDNEPYHYSFKLTTYNRAMWASLMAEVMPVFKRSFDDNLPPYSFYWKSYALRLVFADYENEIEMKDIIASYTAQALFLLAIDVFIPRRRFLTDNQIINGARIIVRKLIDRYWGIISPIHDAANQFWKEFLPEIQFIRNQRDLKLCQIYYFVTFLEDMNKINRRHEISVAFSQEGFYEKVSGQKRSTTKKLQSLCCICLSTSRNGSGCEDHAICDGCWEHGFLPMIDYDDFQSFQPKRITHPLFLQRVFNVIMRSKLFSCVVCNRPLVKNITRYLLIHEKKTPNLAVYINSILHDIETKNILIYNKIRQIAYKNTKLHQLGSANSNSRNQIVIERRPIVDRNSATCEIYLGKWTDKQGIKIDCVVKRFSLTEEGHKWILRELSIAVLCSGLPSIIDCFGSDLPAPVRGTNLPSCCHIAFSLGTKSLADVLKEKISFSIHYILYIMHDIARGLRLLHLLGLTHRDVKPGNVIIFERGENYEAKLIDFGQTRVLNLDKTMQVGTRKYLAPELLYSSNYSQKIDQYSYGVILIELFLHFVNPQYFNDFHNSNDSDNHLDRFLQFNIGQSLINVLSQTYWSQLLEMIKLLLSHNAADRPSFAYCLNIIGEIIKGVFPNQRADNTYEDEQDFTSELERAKTRLSKSNLMMKEIEMEKRYGDCLFQALEIAGSITVDDDFIKAFIRERKIYFENEYNGFQHQVAERRLRPSQMIDLFRSQQRGNAQYDLKSVAKILHANVHLFEFIGSVKYGEDTSNVKPIPLYRDNVRNLFLPIVPLN